MDANEFSLQGGPYAVPNVQVGEQMFCVRRNRTVTVNGLSGILRWPASDDRRTGCHPNCRSLIINNELLRAVATENSKVFSKWFGASVSFWRQMCIHYHYPTCRIARERGEQAAARPLLFGPYIKPECSIGDIVECKERGRVKVQRFSGPIQWPRVTRLVGQNRMGRPTLLVTDELIRAVSSESNVGFAYWFGVEFHTCTKLRKKFGAAGWTEGSLRVAKDVRPPARGRPILWNESSIALLGTAIDHHVAWELDISVAAVAKKRRELKIPAFVNPFSKSAFRKSPNRPPDFLERSLGWAHFREKFIVGKTCAACGGTRFLDVHHVKPFCLFPELEFEESNLLVLCDDEWKNCHHRIGHCFEWKSYNPNAVEDAAASLRSIQNKIRPEPVRQLAETA